MALWRTSLFERAGQMSTQTPHPVQSSGATWMVSCIPGWSCERKLFDGNPAGAAASSPGSYTFIRIAAWGHTRAQRAQSMQIDSSQIGIVAARPRFSKRAVPVGNTPSTGIALTGSRSPSPASMRAVTRCTKSGASAGTAERRERVESATTGTTRQCSSFTVSLMAETLASTTGPPRLPYALRTDFSTAAMASSSGIKLVSAKKATCMIVLICPANPA